MNATTFQHRNLPHLLLAAREALMTRFRPILHSAGITEQQWRVLRTLEAAGPLEPNQIASACQILRPSLTRMLAGMEKSGLIHRSRSDADQRRHRIHLTPASHDLIAQISGQIDQQYGHLEHHLGKDRLQRIFNDIETVLGLLTEDDADQPATAHRDR